jgi:dephospho-CoA kinase
MIIGSLIFIIYLAIRASRYKGVGHKTSIIIGITGTNGSGKGTAVEYLRKRLSFNYYSVREFLTKEIKKRKLPVNRDSMRVVANELREKFGPSYVTDQLLEKALKRGGSAIIESIRNPGEIKSMRTIAVDRSKSRKKPIHFILLAVDATTENRYKRIEKRGSTTDSVTFEKFQTQDHAEATSTSEFKQNLFACRDMADLVLENNGSKYQLEQKINQFISTIKSLL